MSTKLTNQSNLALETGGGIYLIVTFYTTVSYTKQALPNFQENAIIST